ncbi:unannotated protein [freshwater metagenome]|uniref:Unannotated protein n=1 Tax=freshwater metagenome TaxID=449393 RepID=A0A6J7P0H0_9ZZZZ
MHSAGRAFLVLRVVLLRGERVLVVGVLEDASNKHGKACA